MFAVTACSLKMLNIFLKCFGTRQNVLLALLLINHIYEHYNNLGADHFTFEGGGRFAKKISCTAFTVKRNAGQREKKILHNPIFAPPPIIKWSTPYQDQWQGNDICPLHKNCHKYNIEVLNWWSNNLSEELSFQINS